jgi:hypothetical protein
MFMGTEIGNYVQMNKAIFQPESEQSVPHYEVDRKI